MVFYNDNPSGLDLIPLSPSHWRICFEGGVGGWGGVENRKSQIRENDLNIVGSFKVFILVNLISFSNQFCIITGKIPW